MPYPLVTIHAKVVSCEFIQAKVPLYEVQLIDTTNIIKLTIFSNETPPVTTGHVYEFREVAVIIFLQERKLMLLERSSIVLIENEDIQRKEIKDIEFEISDEVVLTQSIIGNICKVSNQQNSMLCELYKAALNTKDIEDDVPICPKTFITESRVEVSFKDKRLHKEEFFISQALLKDFLNVSVLEPKSFVKLIKMQVQIKANKNEIISIEKVPDMVEPHIPVMVQPESDSEVDN